MRARGQPSRERLTAPRTPQRGARPSGAEQGAGGAACEAGRRCPGRRADAISLESRALARHDWQSESALGGPEAPGVHPGFQEVQNEMPSKVPEGEIRGWIVPIGGAENKENDRGILERFVRLSGGADADIVVIPTASRVHEPGPRYEQVLGDIGASRVTVMDFDTRRDCQEHG